MEFRTRIILDTCCLLVFLFGALQSQVLSMEVGNDPTMLMFVGENLEVLTIASRREESAVQAPAVADVITREELRAMGARTIGEILETQPGFYMARREWGSQAYLRGIPDSTLFLYDTVPLVLDADKSLQQLDYELSLAPIKRIEIIRGPGSVLWGPDAFAGIVNIVPMTGKDLDGFETGLLYGYPDDQRGFFVNAGHDGGIWDAFMSVSGRAENQDDGPVNIFRFWGDQETRALPFKDRIGLETPEDPYYIEASGRLAYHDWLSISGIFSQNKSPYAISRAEKDLSWIETRREPFNFIKMEAKKPLDPFSVLRFAGYYSWAAPETDIIGRRIEQEERTAYGELIYERSFWTGLGLFTGGLSYREKQIQDAPFWSGALPPFLGPENEFNLAPQITLVDYTSRLWSIFGQYSHKLGEVDTWLGMRYDAHDPYQDRLSYNIGAKWSPSSRWIFKLLYGTAYRTPHGQQLLEDEEPELENIQSISAQIAWNPVAWAGGAVVGFLNRIEDHRMEDPYAGTELSLSNHQTLYGMELEGFFSPVDSLRMSANLTLMDNTGPDETYKRLKFIRPLPDGEFEKVFEEIQYPSDSGASTLFNLMASWKPAENFILFGRLGYFGSRLLIDPRNEQFSNISGAWILDMSASLTNILDRGIDLQVSAYNLTDRDYQTPGTYSVIDGDPLSVEVTLRKRW